MSDESELSEESESESEAAVESEPSASVESLPSPESAAASVYITSPSKPIVLADQVWEDTLADVGS